MPGRTHSAARLALAFALFGAPAQTASRVPPPDAFDVYGRRVIEANIPRLLATTRDEAHRFACNAVVVGRTVVTNAGCPQLADGLRQWGYKPVAVELNEFLPSQTLGAAPGPKDVLTIGL